MVGMPNTVLCVIPHAVQGTNTDVTVDESSVLRLNSSGRYPRFLYSSRKMEEFMMMERNWSPIIIFNATPDVTVEATRLVVWRR